MTQLKINFENNPNMENNKMSAEGMFRKYFPHPTKTIILLNYKRIMLMVEEYASQQTASLQKQIEEKDAKYDKMLIDDWEHTKKLVNQMKEEKDLEIKNLQSQLKKIDLEWTGQRNRFIEQINELKSQLSQKDEMLKSIKTDLIDLAEYFGKMKESYTEHEMELFLISIGAKINNCLKQYQNSKK